MKNKKIRNIVITGGTSGIGKACKDFFEKKGDNVIIIARKNPENLKNFYPCDVSNQLEVEETFKQIGKKYLHIDVLVNNAGYGISGAVELVPYDEIKNLFDVNLMGVINCYKEAIKYMKKGASIINVSSACALFPLPFRGLYCASKSAVNMLSFSLKMECEPFGVNVCSVCPGDVKTNFTKNRVKHFETNERYKERIKNATEKIDGRENKRMSADKVAKVIYNVSKKKKTRPYVIVGAKYKLLNFVMRFLPEGLLLKFTNKLFGGFEKGENVNG